MGENEETRAKARSEGRQFGFLMLAAGIAVTIWQFSWIKSLIRGPEDAAVAELGKIESADELDNPWVQLDFGKSNNTGLVKTKGKNVVAEYHVIQVGDAWMIAKFPDGFSGSEALGVIETWSSKFNSEVVEKITGKYSRRKFVPFQFDAEYNYRWQGYAMIVVLIFLIGAGTAFILWPPPGKGD